MNKTTNVLSVGELIRLIGVSHLNPTAKPKSYLIVGESGIGKTESMEELARILEISYYNIRTPEIEPYDLVGNWDPKTGAYVTPLLPKEGEPAIILLDEINRGQIPTMQACMRIMEGRGTSTFKYNHNIQTVVGAANPVSDDDIVEILGRALINRPYIVFVEPDVSEWVSWLKGSEKDISKIKEMKYSEEEIDKKIKYYQEKISLFILTYPKYFIMKGTPEGAAHFESVPNPRNWYEASKILALFELAEIQRPIAARIMTKVSASAASDFEEFLKDPEPPVSGKQILEDFPKYKEIFNRHQKQVRYKALATVHDLAYTINKTNLDTKSLKNLKLFLETVDDRNQELIISLFKEINNKNFDILTSEFPDYFDENLRIINEIKNKFEKGGNNGPTWI